MIDKVSPQKVSKNQNTIVTQLHHLIFPDLPPYSHIFYQFLPFCLFHPQNTQNKHKSMHIITELEKFKLKQRKIRKNEKVRAGKNRVLVATLYNVGKS